MIIAENVLEAALAQVFSGQACGHRMSFAEIAQAWGDTGLRLSDLRDAIREAVEQHHLRSFAADSGLVFELTGSGQQRYAGRRERGESAAQWLGERRQGLVTG